MTDLDALFPTTAPVATQAEPVCTQARLHELERILERSLARRRRAAARRRAEVTQRFARGSAMSEADAQS